MRRRIRLPRNAQSSTPVSFTAPTGSFVLAQTEGQDYTPPVLPDWSESKALTTLTVTKESFARLDVNAHGYAQARQIAVNPLAELPHKTLFHELAHIVLGRRPAFRPILRLR